MAQQVINVGTSASDGTGDPLRTAFTKINDNFSELFQTVENEGLTYGNIASNVSGVTFNVTRFTESYVANPVLQGTGQVVGGVHLIRGNVLGGTTPINDVLLTVTSLANATVGNIATVSATGTPVAPVLRVNGLTGNVTLTVNNIDGAASKAYVNAAVSANIANVTGSITDSLNANIAAANVIISNHTSRINTLESNASAQAVQINSLVAVKANIAYVDASIENALSGNAILANLVATNANVAAANAAILLRANLTGANFSGNISANTISASNLIRTDTYFVGGTLQNQSQGQTFANPAAIFFGNSAGSANPYYQVNIQNLDPGGSSDFTATADDGTDLSNYISMGIMGSQYNDPYFPAGYAHDGYVFVTGGNLGLQSNTANIDFFSGNLSSPQISLSLGNVLSLYHNTVIRFSDGTIQSTAFGGNANVSVINANIAAANIAISNLQSNASLQALDIDAIYSNLGQTTSRIDVTQANLGSFQTYANSNIGSLSLAINSLTANAGVQTIQINLINANVSAANTTISNLVSNASAQSLALDNLTSNSVAQESTIVGLTANVILLNSNLTAANINISSLTSNSAVQAVQLNLINANLIASNTNITNLQANLGSYQTYANTVIIDIQFNQNAINANIGSFQTLSNNYANIVNESLSFSNNRINSINANIGSYQIYSNANAASQTNLINTKANINGATFSGNVQAPWFISNSGILATGGLTVGLPTPANYPGTVSSFVSNIGEPSSIYVQNLSYSSNAVTQIKILANDGNANNNYVTIGMTSSAFTGNFTVPAGDTGITSHPHDGFLVTIGGNSSIATDQSIYLVANTSVVSLLKDGNFVLGSGLQFSDSTVQTTAVQDVPGLLSNVSALNANLNVLSANIGAFENYIDANVGALATDFGNLDANVGTISTNFSVLSANIGAFETYIDANVGVISNDLANIDSNLGTTTTNLNNFDANIGTVVTNLNLLNANVGAFEIYIDANVGSLVGDVNNLNANIGAYQLHANANTSFIWSNITSINATLINKANLSGAVFSGNVQADYLLANSNVKIAKSLEVGLPGTISLVANSSSFVGNANTFYRINLQNLSSANKAVSEYRVTANDGNISTKYAAFGLTNSAFAGNFTVPAGDTGVSSSPYDGYMVTIGGNSSVVTDQSIFLVANTSVVYLNKDSDFVLTGNTKLRFGDNSFIANANIGSRPYTPNNAANYNNTITNVQQALDELAARLRALGG